MAWVLWIFSVIAFWKGKTKLAIWLLIIGGAIAFAGGVALAKLSQGK